MSERDCIACAKSSRVNDGTSCAVHGIAALTARAEAAEKDRDEAKREAADLDERNSELCFSIDAEEERTRKAEAERDTLRRRVAYLEKWQAWGLRELERADVHGELPEDPEPLDPDTRGW